MAFQFRLDGPDSGVGIFDELLPAEAGEDAHKEHIVCLVQIREDLFHRAVRIDDDTGLYPKAVDEVQDLSGGSVEHFLGHTSADEHAHLVHHHAAPPVLPLLRQAPGETQGVSARDDAHLEHRVCVRQQPAHQGVTCLMIRRRLS